MVEFFTKMLGLSKPVVRPLVSLPAPVIPASASSITVIRLTKRYLRRCGWQILPPFDWFNVMIRAQSENVYISLLVFDVATLGWELTIRDLTEMGQKMGCVIGVVSVAEVPPHIKQLALESSTYAISVTELPELKSISTRATVFAEERRQKALAL